MEECDPQGCERGGCLPRKRAMIGRRVMEHGGPSKYRDRGAKVRNRISGESEPPVRYASEVTGFLRFRISRDGHSASAVCEEQASCCWRRSSATSQGRHRPNRSPKRNSEVM